MFGQENPPVSQENGGRVPIDGIPLMPLSLHNAIYQGIK